MHFVPFPLWDWTKVHLPTKNWAKRLLAKQVGRTYRNSLISAFCAKLAEAKGPQEGAIVKSVGVKYRDLLTSTPDFGEIISNSWWSLPCEWRGNLSSLSRRRLWTVPTFTSRVVASNRMLLMMFLVRELVIKHWIIDTYLYSQDECCLGLLAFWFRYI